MAVKMKIVWYNYSLSI